MSLRFVALTLTSMLSTGLYLAAAGGYHIPAALLTGLLVFAFGIFVFAIKGGY